MVYQLSYQKQEEMYTWTSLLNIIVLYTPLEAS